MNLDASLERLFHRNLHIVKLDLEPMRALMARLGNPQDQLACIHVAGTNGKGSVCAMLESILRAQGYKTGLYTSPHLVRFNERIQICGEQIKDPVLLSLITEVENAASELTADGLRDVTFFEFTTAVALLHFVRSGVHVAVIETGMGGRLDATNVITPALSIITSISLEHTAYLGDTLAAIAGEKAGIIKEGRPVIVGAMPDEAMSVMADCAKRLNAPLHKVNDLITVRIHATSWEGQSLDIASANVHHGIVKCPLVGVHQAGNAAIAVAAAECLNNEVGVPLSEEAIKKGMAATRWPARGQLLSLDPPVVLDGAHNVEAAAALAAWVKKTAGKKAIGLVVGFLSDKDPAAVLKCFGSRAKKVWIVPIHSERAMSVEDVARRLSFLPHVEKMADVSSAVEAAWQWAANDNGVVVITGSLYLAGEVISQAAQSGERPMP